jgi:hypothetical protein
MTHYYIENVTIGSDPELFIVNTKTNTVVSSIGIIPGKKKQAFLPEDFQKGFGLQTDNILAEFNIPPVELIPGASKVFLSHIVTMKEYIRNFVKQINFDYDILCTASELVPEDQLQSDEAKQFGCEPDYNVYTLSQNEAPKGNLTNLRTTGTHIHVGYTNNNLYTSLGLLKVLDLFLGVPSILIDKDDRRRSLYGKAGCFRLTDYGVEYRVLSGYFIKDKIVIDWVFKQIVEAVNYYNTCMDIYLNESDRPNSFSIEKYLPSEESIFNSINNGNIISAKRIIKKYQIALI